MDSSDHCGGKESPPSSTIAADPACESCGQPSAREMAGQWHCDDCIAAAGSGCAGPANAQE